MVLGFKQKFPDLTPTNFREKILAGSPTAVAADPDRYKRFAAQPKIHTIRAGTRWKAGYHLHMAYGARTPYYDQFNEGIPELEKCISTQKVIFQYSEWGFIYATFPERNSVYSSGLGEMEILLRNDGLTFDQFLSLFFPDGPGSWEGQIIHWTDFNY